MWNAKYEISLNCKYMSIRAVTSLLRPQKRLCFAAVSIAVLYLYFHAQRVNIFPAGTYEPYASCVWVPDPVSFSLWGKKNNRESFSVGAVEKNVYILKTLSTFESATDHSS